MHILLLGKNGQLGWELQRTLAPLGEIIALGQRELNLEDTKSIREKIQQIKPQFIVNAAAYTNVDRAESDVSKVYAINATAPGVLAEEAAKSKAVLIHYSTDYVFDGGKTSPYTEDDLPNPLNVYGKSKLDGEQAIQSVENPYFIFRTSWVYSFRRESFAVKVLRWAREKETLRVVDDQVGSPTWARMLAELTAHAVAKMTMNPDDPPSLKGIYHLAGAGAVSRYEWAREILKLDPHREEQCYKSVEAAQSSGFITPAQRPVFSALRCTRFISTFRLRVPSWQENLQLAMTNYQK